MGSSLWPRIPLIAHGVNADLRSSKGNTFRSMQARGSKVNDECAAVVQSSQALSTPDGGEKGRCYCKTWFVLDAGGLPSD